ncbi:Accessory protein regulator B [compost metagenome]
MIEYAAQKLSRRINSIVPEANVNIMAYEIARQINFYSIIVLTILIGTLTGKIFESILAMTGCATLRRLSGGRHLSLTACTVFSVSLFTISPILPITHANMLLLTCLTILILLIYSKKGAKIKFFSIALVSANFLILSPALAVVYTVQAVSIIHRKGGAR